MQFGSELNNNLLFIINTRFINNISLESGLKEDKNFSIPIPSFAAERQHNNNATRCLWTDQTNLRNYICRYTHHFRLVNIIWKNQIYQEPKILYAYLSWTQI